MTAELSWNDRGLAFGDGLFETIFVDAGRPLMLVEHLARLRFGLSRLGLPEPSGEAVVGAIDRAIPAGKSGVCKLLITAGSGPRGYARPVDPAPTVRALFAPLPPVPTEALVVVESPVPVAGIPALRGLKHLNRLPQVLARERLPAGAHEGLMRDAAGRVVSGTMSNLFWREGRRWCTPPVTDGSIAGTRRAWWVERLEAEIRPCAAGRLAAAEQAFCCNAVSAWRPVGRLLGRDLTVPAGPPDAGLRRVGGVWQPAEDADSAPWKTTLDEALAASCWGRTLSGG
ncbi:MAG: aminotransferase class IV [Pseudomonadota bacterium]